MKRLAPFFVWLELVGLGMWIGGMAALVLIAPTVFNIVKPVEMAGETMSRVFRNFNGAMVFIYIILIAAGFLGRWFLNSSHTLSRRIEAGILVALIVSGLYVGVVLGPRMQELRHIKSTDPSNTGAVVQFDRDHRVAERLFVINMILGLSVLFMVLRELVGSDGMKKGSL